MNIVKDISLFLLPKPYSSFKDAG